MRPMQRVATWSCRSATRAFAGITYRSADPQTRAHDVPDVVRGGDAAPFVPTFAVALRPPSNVDDADRRPRPTVSPHGAPAPISTHLAGHPAAFDDAAVAAIPSRHFEVHMRRFQQLFASATERARRCAVGVASIWIRVRNRRARGGLALATRSTCTRRRTRGAAAAAVDRPRCAGARSARSVRVVRAVAGSATVRRHSRSADRYAGGVFAEQRQRHATRHRCQPGNPARCQTQAARRTARTRSGPTRTTNGGSAELSIRRDASFAWLDRWRAESARHIAADTLDAAQLQAQTRRRSTCGPAPQRSRTTCPRC